MSAGIRVDAEQIGRFVEAMFRHADEGTFASLRSFTHDAGDPPVEIRGVEINGAGLAPLIQIAVGAANRAARHRKPTVFAPPVATFTSAKRAREADLANGLGLSVEIDAAATAGLALLRGLIGPPTVAVASGGEWTDPAAGEVQAKLHGHWRLSEPTRTTEEHGRLKRIRRLAAALVGGDASNVPSVHPIRWPGSVHRKGEPKLANIVEFNEFAEIDLGDALDSLEAAAVARGIFAEGTANGGGGGSEQRETAALIAEIMAGRAYTVPLTALSARYAGGGMTRPKIIDTLQGLMLAVPVGIRDDGQLGRWQSRFGGIPRMAASAVAKFGPKPADGQGHTEEARERITLAPATINKAARRCAEMLADTVYMRGRFPSAVVPAGEINPDAILGGVRHDRSSLVMVTATAGMAQFKLDELASFFRRDARGKTEVQVSCPKDLAQRLIDAATDMPFRQCSGIVSVPLFIDGHIIDAPGYHAATGRVIAFDGPLPAIPERPGKADALAALDVLLRPFRGYLSGDDPQLRSGLAAAALTAIARPSLPTAPAMVLDANTPGAGKGKLARALAVLATGTLPSVITEGHAEEETEKRIASAVLSGGPVLLLDNMQRTLASSALESALTEGVATIRLFGKLGEDITVPFSALVIITANNAALRADLLRRVLPIRILVDTDEPEKREFGFDPYLEAKNDRLRILAAGFTILRAWWSHRSTTRTLGSFEHWAAMVAGAVEWLTGINPISLIEERKAEDPARGEERQVITALHALFGTIEWTAKEAVGRPAPAYQPADNPTPATGLDPDIWRGVLDFKTERPSPKEVGKWLSRQKDKVFGDLRLACRLGSDKVGLWKVVGRVQGYQKGSNPPSPREMSKHTPDSVVTDEDTEGRTNPVEPGEPGASWQGTL